MRLARRISTISAGDLKDRCELMQPIYGNDGRGGHPVTFVSVGSVWCKATSRNNSRTLSEAQVTYFDAFTFIIRVSTLAVSGDWHINFNGKNYTIHGTPTDIDNRYQYLSILAYSPKLG